MVPPTLMPSSSQYGSAGPPGYFGRGPITGAASPGPPGPVQAPPPVMVTNVLPRPVVVWMTSESCTNPLRSENPMVGPAGPMVVSEKNQASWEEFSRMADTPSPPAQSAQLEWSE